MFCEVCGEPIRGEPVRAVLEGARLIVCRKCAEHSQDTWQPPVKRVVKFPVPRPAPMTARRREPDMKEDVELTREYPTVVRNAREKIGITQKELAFRCKVKESLIQKIEQGRFNPELGLARILEHILKVRLVVPHEEVKVVPMVQRPSEGTTLGDIARVREKST